MLEVLTQILTFLSHAGFGYLAWLILKGFVTTMICRHPELSNEKVKYITSMISKDKHHFN